MATFINSANGGTGSATTFSITLPATQAGDIIILEYTHRGTADATLGGTYSGPAFTEKHDQQFASSTFSGKTLWSRATGNHSGQTVTGSGLTNSCAAIVTVYRGCLTSGDPLADATIVGEQNASGNETQAEITTATNGAWVVLVVANSPDVALSAQTCTSPGTLTERVEVLSTAGTDTSIGHASAEKATAGATGAFTWAQTDGASGSWAYAIKPDISPTITSIDSDNDTVDTRTGVVIVGTNFGASETGSAKVEVSNNATYGSGTIVEVDVTSWSATSITVTLRRESDSAALGTLFTLPLSPAYLWVTEITGFRNATGLSFTLNAAGATWLAALDTTITIDVSSANVQKRLRGSVENTGGAAGGTGFKWQYRKNGGTWTDITASSSNVKTFASSYYADGDDVPQLLTGGTYQSDNNAAEESTGTFTLGAGLPAAAIFESEIALEFIKADVAHNDTLDFRIVTSAGVALDTYDVTPQVTIQESGAATQAAADTISLTEDITAQIAKRVQENLGLTEADIFQVGKVISETVSLSESLARIVIRTQAGADTVSLTEDLVARVGRAFSETVALTESLSKQVAKRVQESLGLSEADTFQIQKRIAESVSLTESLTAIAIKSQAGADTVSLVEDLVIQVSRALGETLALTETLRKQVTKGVQETLGLSEADTIQVGKMISESVSLTEELSVVATVLKTQGAADTVSLVEDLTARITKAYSETVAFTETLTKQVTRGISETVSLTESDQVQVQRRINESLGLSENLGTTLVKLVNVGDSLSMVESLQKQTGKTVAEAIALTEGFIKRTGKSLTDTLAFAEDLTAVTGKRAQENLGLAENLVTMMVKSQAVSDSLQFVESLRPVALKAITDTLGFVENLDVVVTKSLSESLGVTEQLVKYATRTLGVEALGLSESFQAAIIISEQFACLLTEGVLIFEIDEGYPGYEFITKFLSERDVYETKGGIAEYEFLRRNDNYYSIQEARF